MREEQIFHYMYVTCAEALFFGGNFSGKAIKIQFADQHDRAWHTAKIALFSTVLWVPVGLGMIAVSPPFSPHQFVMQVGTILHRIAVYSEVKIGAFCCAIASAQDAQHSPIAEGLRVLKYYQ